MQYINKLSLALAIAAIPTALAQTFSDCDPTKRTDCPTKPGLNTAEYSVDFRTGADALKDWTTTSGTVNSVADGAEFKIEKLGDGPTIQSNFYMFFGYVEAVMKAAPGAGIVSSLVMQSDVLDEIDWEWIGSDTGRAQTNYFGKGNTTTYDRGQFHPVANPETEFRKYAVNWTQETTTWLIDDVPVRTLNFADAVGGTNYPQTPINVRIGNWVAGDPKNAAGTIEWAGGLTDFSKGPFSMYVQSVKIINYNPAASYQYTDQTGQWQSIKTLGGAATAPPTESGSSNSTTGGGEVPFSDNSSAAAAASGSGPLPTVSIGLGSNSGNGAAASQSGAVPTAPCSTVTGAAASESGNSGNGNAGSAGLPKTVTIGLGASGMAGMSRPTGLAGTNSTGGNGGIVGQGVPSNATLPTYTINPGGNSGNGAAASSETTTLATQTPGAATNPAQTSFGLGSQNSTSTTTGGPQQVTSSSGSRVKAGGLAALLGVGLMFL
jgi:hypothetical protein